MARIAPILRSFSDRVVVIDDVTEEGWRALQDAGVSRTELERIAGADRVIRGDRELEQLSRLLARVDDICAPAAELPSARVVATLEAVARRTRGMDRAGFLARYATCGFELRELSDADWSALEAVGIHRRRLAAIAGSDFGIHSRQELSDLFTQLEALDRDGNARRMELAIGERKTAPGEAVDILERVLRPRERIYAVDDPSAALRADPEARFRQISLGVVTKPQGADDCLDTTMSELHDFRPPGTPKKAPRLDTLIASPLDAHYMAKGEDAAGRITGYAADFQAGKSYIDACLEAGRPVIVGVSHSDRDYNHDGITDHFVVISGRGVDEEGRLFYIFNDSANTAVKERFYVDPATGMLYKPPNPRIAAGFVAALGYQVTQVRVYSDTDFKKTTGRAAAPPP